MLQTMLSVIIPAYNEAALIDKTMREAHAVIGGAMPFEIIVIDDGSDDGLAEVAEKTAAALGQCRVIRHPDRAGKSSALRTGALAARGRWIAMMDGDGQNDPAYLIAMANEINLAKVERVGLVAGNRKSRHDGQSRKLASRFANGLRRRLLNDDCPDTACGLKIISRDLFLAMPFFDALHRFLPAFANHLGYDVVNVPVNDRPRDAGHSKYSNIGRATAGFFDLMGVIWLMRRAHIPSADFIRSEFMIREFDDAG